MKQCIQLMDRPLKALFYASLVWLRNHQQVINSLNVFPVPDGDTGTNMFLTMQSAYSEISDSKDKNVGKIAHMISQGALMGARGNSGVILSQLLRGFARLLDDKEILDADMLVEAFAESRNTAYKGVVRPVEGTILTVAKDIARASEEVKKETKDFTRDTGKDSKSRGGIGQEHPEPAAHFKAGGCGGFRRQGFIHHFGGYVSSGYGPNG